MHYQELQSTKYFANAATEEPMQGRRSRWRRQSRKGEFMFRMVLIAGIVWSVHWFYKHQDPILANIRDNSSEYSLFFSDLVTYVSGDDIQQNGATLVTSTGEYSDATLNTISFPAAP